MYICMYLYIIRILINTEGIVPRSRYIIIYLLLDRTVRMSDNEV